MKEESQPSWNTYYVPSTGLGAIATQGLLTQLTDEAIEVCWVEPLAEAYMSKIWWGLGSRSGWPDSEARIVSLLLLQVDEKKGVCVHTYTM